MTGANTLFLRVEGALQAWGHNSKFVIRRTMPAPTKSGILGMICCARGLPRVEARGYLRRLNALCMGVRTDRAGLRWWDYHTVGARVGMLRADGKGVKRTKRSGKSFIETLVTRREYLCDASFLVALQGDNGLVREVHRSLAAPEWPVCLGRRSCPPSLPVVSGNQSMDLGEFPDLRSALCSQAWRPRHRREPFPRAPLLCFTEWRPSQEQPFAPPDADVWYDVPVSLEPPVHRPRLVQEIHVKAGTGKDVPVGSPRQHHTPPPPRPRADYRNAGYMRKRAQRIEQDQHLCVFCKTPATTVQHVTYRRAGGDEETEDLRSLCRLCHDAVTMVEYGLGMGLDRINPEDPCWRERIIATREKIIRYRSLATRRRRLAAEEVV